MEKWMKIIVDKSVKPISIELRKEIPLNVGGDYFVSFGNNEVHRCILSEIIKLSDLKQIKIEIPIRPKSKNGFIDINGNLSHNWISSHIIYSNEIGLTPEEAVINGVTF